MTGIYYLENEARMKLGQKDYADRNRSARKCDISERDMVLLNQIRLDKKLLKNYEPDPYKVTSKDANAVLVKNSDRSKMRNASNMKKNCTTRI